MGIGIAAIGPGVVAIAVGHVTAAVPIRVVCSTERRVAVQSAVERGGTTSRRTAG